MICTACLEPILDGQPTTSEINEGVKGYVIWHSTCAPPIRAKGVRGE